MLHCWDLGPRTCFISRPDHDGYIENNIWERQKSGKIIILGLHLQRSP